MAGSMAGRPLWLAATAPPARPDAAAGREAYEKGDYKRAMVEWQAGADRHEPEAEFGLGRLYEFGAGDLKQNYKQADYWYSKAADQGNAGAQYRLALIWTVGGEDFAADLAEAYIWASLAVDSKGIWSTLAADLKSQLDKVTSAEQRVDAERRVGSGRRNSPRKKNNLPQRSLRLRSRPAPRKGRTGCPGWPFPTLPCTEQFPASGNLYAAARANSAATDGQSPLEELNEALAQIDCAALHSETSAQGSAENFRQRAG